MADLVRAFDWSATPLGPVESWSDTLITTVNLMLASSHPMFLWWGKDLIQFYNDGYRPSIRADKHPSALGQRGIECWPEIWPIIGPQIDAVMNSGASTWNINQLVPISRDGKIEEVFWTYSYSPVRDQAGMVRGTLVVCSETTEQVLSERRLRALLAITAETAEPDRDPSDSLLDFAQRLSKTLSTDPADMPFTAMYVLRNGQILHACGQGGLSDPRHWPIDEVARTMSSRLVEEIPQSAGILTFAPWPEPVTRAYMLPLGTSEPDLQVILVFGLSPRLPFDNPYKTFLQLVGARVASLIESEVHKLQIAGAAKRFTSLAQANPFGTVIGDFSGAISYINPEFLKTLGYSEEDVSSRKLRWDAITPPEHAGADVRAIQQLRETGRCDVYEKAYLAKDGRLVPILIGAAAIGSVEGNFEIAAFVTDLSPLKVAQQALRAANEELERKVEERTAALESEVHERKRAEMNLRELTGRLLLAQDEERRHMARELHDHAGQTLIALSLNFAALLEAAKGQNPTVIKLVTQSQQLSDDLSKEIRTLSYLLHPPLLDEAGLRSALQWYVEGFTKRSGIKVELELPEDSSRVQRSVEMVVFRVIQESLTNIHRHSGSPSASIRLTRGPGVMKVEIADRGTGISPQKRKQMSAARMGVGVRGMEERVRQFGGTFEFRSGSSGTTVSATIPLAVE